MRIYRAGEPKSFPKLGEKFYIVQASGCEINSMTTFGPFATEREAEQFCNAVGGSWLIHSVGKVS